MGQLIYTAIASLDGYIEDDTGSFEWAAPDEEVFRFVGELERPIGTYLYGRRMYETMVPWETILDGNTEMPFAADFARMWRTASKVVFSRTLLSVASAKTSLAQAFDVDTISQLKSRSNSDLSVGGADLASQALRYGLVDELRLYLHPISVGNGKPALPANQMVRLKFLEERSFRSGVVFTRYSVIH